MLPQVAQCLLREAAQCSCTTVPGRASLHARDVHEVPEVAAALKLKQQTIRNWIDAGTLPPVRLGRRVPPTCCWRDGVIARGASAAVLGRRREPGSKGASTRHRPTPGLGLFHDHARHTRSIGVQADGPVVVTGIANAVPHRPSSHRWQSSRMVPLRQPSVTAPNLPLLRYGRAIRRSQCPSGSLGRAHWSRGYCSLCCHCYSAGRIPAAVSRCSARRVGTRPPRIRTPPSRLRSSP